MGAIVARGDEAAGGVGGAPQGWVGLGGLGGSSHGPRGREVLTSQLLEDSTRNFGTWNAELRVLVRAGG